MIPSIDSTDLITPSSTPPINPIISSSSITHIDALLNDSRIAPTSNGSILSKPICDQPTSGQKWWASIVLGFIFALVSSPAAYYATSKITMSLGGASLTNGPGPTYAGLLLHTIIFIIIIRVILW
jgi:hypothetical protein